MTPRMHGDTTGVPMESLLWPDPELALVHANLHAWNTAHPCNCHALCNCEWNQPETDDDS